MTIPELKRWIQQTGLRPDRAAGQHFLLDESVVERMAELAGVGPKDTVLEIGAGFGVLTSELLRRGATVIAVELDKRLTQFLRRRFMGEKKFQLVEGDVFRIRLDQPVKDGAYKLVANLPYSVTSGVFRQFLSRAPRPTLMAVLIQKEVAERIVAGPGAMSLLSLSVQYYGQPTKEFDVPPAAFFPSPAVTSSVLSVRDIKISGSEPVEMFRYARMAFAGKRKQLQNSLAAGLHIPAGQVVDQLLELGIAPEIRPQELSVKDWLRLAKKFTKK